MGAAATMYSGTVVVGFFIFVSCAGLQHLSGFLGVVCENVYLLDFSLDKQILAVRDQNGPAGETPNSPTASAVAPRPESRALSSLPPQDPRVWCNFERKK